MMQRFLKCLGLVSLAVVAACSSKEERVSNLDVARSALKAGLFKKQVPPSGLTRAQISGITAPLLLVTFEKTGGQGLLETNAIVRDFVTWRTADDVEITLQNQMISSTRRLGEDLMSSLTPGHPENQSMFRREYSYLNGEEKIQSFDADCTYGQGGAANVLVLDVTYSTRILSENCKSAALGSIANTYWLDERGIAVKSRQFVGPDVGYLVIERINS